MNMKMGTIAAALSLLATGALAAPPADGGAVDPAQATAPAEQEVAVAETAPEEEKKICRTEKVTGSLSRRTRICMTEAQWREVYDRTRRGVGDLQNDSSGGKMCVPNPSDPFQGCPG